MNTCDASKLPIHHQTRSLEKWLVLTQYYPPEIGAPQIRLRSFVRELQRHGRQVVVYTAMPNYPTGAIFPSYRGRLYCHEVNETVHVHRVWAYAASGRSTVARLLNYCSFAVNILPVLLFVPKPDVIFVEAQPLPLGLVALLLKYLRKIPYIYNVPDMQVDVARQLGFLRQPFLLRIAEKLETVLMKNAFSVSTVTHSFAKHIQQRGIPARSTTFLPNGADTAVLTPRPPDTQLLADWNLQGKIAVVYVGTHAYYHGLDTIIEAAERLKSDPRIQIVMIGDGPERERIIQLTKLKQLSNVIFGEASYDRTANLYSVAYAAVATLRDLPVAAGMRLSKVFPALSCGVPVIYSGKGEAAELLIQHECGLVVPPEQPQALAEAISGLADSPQIRSQLGTNGRRFVETEYSWSTIVKRWLAAIQELYARQDEDPATDPTVSASVKMQVRESLDPGGCQR